MQTLLEIGQYAWALFWLPLLIWTGVMLTVMGILKLIPSRWPQIQLDIRLAGLLSLFVGLAVTAIIHQFPESPVPVYVVPSPFLVVDTSSLVASSPVAMNLGFSWLHGIGVLTVIASLVSLMGVFKLISSSFMLKNILATAQPIDVSEIDRSVQKSDVRCVESDQVQVAFSAGLFTRWIVLPSTLAPEDRRMVLLHELNHHLSGDVSRAWISSISRALFFFHPLVHAIHQQCMLLTEIVCDRRVLDSEYVDLRSYADLLLRNTPNVLQAGPALTLAHSPSQLRNRISAMKDLVSLPFNRLQLRYLGVATILIMGLMVGCSESEIAPTAPDVSEDAYDLVMELPESPAAKSDEVFSIVEQAPVLLGGLSGIQAEIKYPEIAKNAGIQGRVFLQFVVNPDGSVRDVVVARGIGAGCDEEAVRAMKSARFVPGTQRGVRVPVKMSLPVTFKLDENGEPDLTTP